MIPFVTWSSYLCDGLSKIVTDIKSTYTTSKSFIVIIFSHDVHLVGRGNENPNNLLQCLDDFNKSLIKIFGNINIKIKIICTNLNIYNISMQYNSNRDDFTNITVQKYIIPSLNKITTNSSNISIKFELLANIKCYYDYELRSWLLSSVPTIQSNLCFQGNGNASNSNSGASISMELVGCTLPACDTMHEGLSRPEVLCTIPKTGIDPICLDGKSILVRPTEAMLPLERYVVVLLQ